MRTMMKMQIPVEAGNRAASAIEATLKKPMADLKPEAAYFYADNGTHGAMVLRHEISK
jgi:hypothetical protein